MGKKKKNRGPNQQNRPGDLGDQEEASDQPVSRAPPRTEEDRRTPYRGAEGGIQPAEQFSQAPHDSKGFQGSRAPQGQNIQKAQQFSQHQPIDDSQQYRQDIRTKSFQKGTYEEFQQSKKSEQFDVKRGQQSFPYEKEMQSIQQPRTDFQKGAQQLEKHGPQYQQTRPDSNIQRGPQQHFEQGRQGKQYQQTQLGTDIQREGQQSFHTERQDSQYQQTRPDSNIQRGPQQGRQGKQYQQTQPGGDFQRREQQSFPSERQGPQHQQTRPDSNIQKGPQQYFEQDRQGKQYQQREGQQSFRTERQDVQYQQTRPDSNIQRGPQQGRQGKQYQQTQPGSDIQREQQSFPTERQGSQHQQTRPGTDYQRGEQQSLPKERQSQQFQQTQLESDNQRNIQKKPWGKKEPVLEVLGDVSESDKSQEKTAILPQQPMETINVEDIAQIEQDMENLEISASKSKPISSPSKESPARSNGKTKYLKLNINFNVTPTQRQKFLPKRPDDGGKKGRSIQLIINCLDVKIKPMKIFMYDIELTKAEVIGTDKKTRDVLIKMKKKDILRKVISEYLKDKGGVPVFDGGRIIFSNKLLPFPDGIHKPTLNYKMDNETVNCYFTIQHVKDEDIELDSLNNYVKNKGRSDEMPQEALRALDTIMREMFLNKNLLSLGRNAIFDPKTSKPLMCGPYVLMEGYSTTIRPHMWNVRFNFDKTQVVCHEAINLLQYIQKIMNIDRGFNANLLGRKLKTLRVQSEHLKTNEGKPYSRKYTIFGFSKLNAKETKIAEKNMSIEQYFLKEHNIKLKRPDLPMIKVNPNKETFIPIELLTMLPHQKVLDSDGKIVQEVIKFAAIPCFKRLDILRKSISSLELSNRADKYLQNYMIDISPNLINLTGRILDGPEALFGNSKKEFIRSGKWDFRGKRFLNPYPHVVNWALFAVGVERDYQRNERPLYDVEEQLAGAADRVGIHMAGSFNFCYVVNQKIEMVAMDLIEKSKMEKKKLDLLVFVVNSDDDYRAVKRFGDMTYGIVTQCMKYANLSRQKAMDQYLANIMLKINGKLGGTNWELSAIKNCFFAPIKQPFMIFGIDVTHPASNKNDLMKSIAAMVGSLDNNASIYRAIIRQQISKQERSIVELVLEMEDMVHHLLLSFFQANRTLKPKHLIFYRDGVSEGQFDIVFRHEINAIQNACQKLDPGYQPPITYIIVQKRHKIRFFPQNEKDTVGRSGNVPPGTIVDRDITHCREFDFYLCSHEGIQGTSKPAHYHVLFDENNWGSDDLQNFTYYLCHMYARCTRSVSYPAPTYYAHLAAFRGRTLIGQSDDDSTSKSSGHSGRTESNDSKILINDFHNNKLFFI